MANKEKKSTKSSSSKKWLKRVLFISCLFALLIYLFLMFFVGTTTRYAVKYLGPQILGVPVAVQNVDIGLFFNRLTIEGIEVGNPEGFSDAEMLKIEKIQVRIQLLSLLKDVKTIKELTIKGVNFTYETKLTSSNLGTLLTKLESEQKTEPETQETTSSGSDLKFIVNEINIEDVKVKLGFSQLGGKGVLTPLPSVHLQDVGKDENGISITGLSVKLLNSLLNSAKETIVDIGGGLEKVGSGLFNGIKNVGGKLFGPSDKEEE